MKRISDLNTLIVFIIMSFVLLTGPTLYIFNTFVESTDSYISDFKKMSFITDAKHTTAEHTGGQNRVGNWTVFLLGMVDYMDAFCRNFHCKNIKG